MRVSEAVRATLGRIGISPETDGPTSSSPIGPPRPHNTHIHLPPNFSAFDSVAEAVEAASAEGVVMLGVSNYYHYGVYGDFARAARDAGIFPLFGTEIICLVDDLVQRRVRINDPANPGKMYICGKAITRFDPLSAEAETLLGTIREKDSLRMAMMVERLGQVFRDAGFDADLDEAQVKDMVVQRHGCPLDSVYLQERHIAQAFQERMAARLSPELELETLTRAYGGPPKADVADAVATQNEIRSRLMKAGKPGYVEETFVDFDHAYQLILALGGIPCYPVLADGAEPICEFEDTPAALIRRIRQRAIPSAEFIPERNRPEALERYAMALRRAGIFITAGTEHNTRDRIPITPRCKGGVPVPPAVQELFWEGACVLVGHMYRLSRGLAGFPAAADGSHDDRISSFAALGEAVLRAYA
jgi:hypothetical protein